MIKETFDKMKKSSKYMIVTGIVFLIISIPTFLDYNMFTRYNANIGPNQIGSWVSFFFAFVGFVLLIMGFGQEDM
ncbi:hypothetical protein [Ferroplasma sp.]|uniref:hypothetical protein n=1 Tax=Ferroplasma sp. TaxID=2591003 RepID=UPI00307EDF37